MTDDKTRGEVEDMCMVFHQSIRQLAEEFRRYGFLLLCWSSMDHHVKDINTAHMNLGQLGGGLKVELALQILAAALLYYANQLLGAHTNLQGATEVQAAACSADAQQVCQAMQYCISNTVAAGARRQDCVPCNSPFCRYAVGLDKLLAAESEVNVMKQELIELQPKLIQTGKALLHAPNLPIPITDQTARTHLCQ